MVGTPQDKYGERGLTFSKVVAGSTRAQAALEPSTEGAKTEKPKIRKQNSSEKHDSLRHCGGEDGGRGGTMRVYRQTCEVKTPMDSRTKLSRLLVNRLNCESDTTKRC